MGSSTSRVTSEVSRKMRIDTTLEIRTNPQVGIEVNIMVQVTALWTGVRVVTANEIALQLPVQGVPLGDWRITWTFRI